MEAIIGDAADYNIVGAPLLFGALAASDNCIVDEELCFTFLASQDDIKEEEEKFKLTLSTLDLDVCFCPEQAHVAIEEDANDGKNAE